MSNVVEIAVKQPKTFRVDGVDHRLEFPVSAVITIEEKLGRSMKSVSDWLEIKTKELPDILEAGFTKHQAAPGAAREIADSVCNSLDPEGIEIVIDALCWATHPTAMARFQKQIDEARERAKNGTAQLPNAPGADAH